MSQAPPTYNSAFTYPTQPQGYPPPGGYPPQGGPGYPPQSAPGYPPQNGPGYPPQGGPAYPPQGGYAYPPQGQPYQPGYPPQGYPPPQAGAYGGYTNTTPVEEAPKDEDGEAGQGGDFSDNSFSDKAIRRAFIKKVYLILFTQLLTTVAFICFFMFVLPVKMWVRRNSWFYYLSFGVFIVTYIMLVCCPTVRRKYPGNFIALGIFTLAFSYMCGTITSYYDIPTVLIAAGITCAVCLAISIFAIQTKFDFTMCSGLLFAFCMVVFFFGIACLIVYATIGFSYIMHCVYGALAALLFSAFLAYDTQMLMGKHKHKLSEEEYIFGALQLYLDVVYLFLIILSCFGGSNS